MHVDDMLELEYVTRDVLRHMLHAIQKILKPFSCLRYGDGIKITCEFLLFSMRRYVFDEIRSKHLLDLNNQMQGFFLFFAENANEIINGNDKSLPYGKIYGRDDYGKIAENELQTSYFFLLRKFQKYEINSRTNISMLESNRFPLNISSYKIYYFLTFRVRCVEVYLKHFHRERSCCLLEFSYGGMAQMTQRHFSILILLFSSLFVLLQYIYAFILFVFFFISIFRLSINK